MISKPIILICFIAFYAKAQRENNYIPFKPATKYSATDARMVVNNSFRQTTGDVESLKNLKKVNIVYNYSSMSVCDYPNERAYLEFKRKHMSGKKYDAFLEHWKSMRKVLLEPKFEEMFGRYNMVNGLNAMNDTVEATATLRVDIFYMDPEDHRFDDLPPPYLKTLCTFLSGGEILAQFEFTAVGSRERTMDNRLAECFANAGKMLSKGIAEELREAERNKKSATGEN